MTAVGQQLPLGADAERVLYAPISGPNLKPVDTTELMHSQRHSLGASTIRGSRIVKVDPRPGSLSTVMSPPIIWQNLRLMTSPRPVPPYLLAVADEA
jgi:hypothetical protein